MDILQKIVLKMSDPGVFAVILNWDEKTKVVSYSEFIDKTEATKFADSVADVCGATYRMQLDWLNDPATDHYLGEFADLFSGSSKKTTISGIIDGVNTIFTTEKDIDVEKFMLFQSGQLMTVDYDFTASGNTITFTVPPEADDILTAFT
jgi:hypothetical protein